MEIYVSRTVPPAGPRQKEVFARVDTGRWQMEGRIMLPAGWWGKCDCELSTLCKSDKRHDIRTRRIQSPIRRFYLLIWIGVSTTTVSGVWSYCNRTNAMFFVWNSEVFGVGKLCINFDECCFSSMYSNWFIENQLMDDRLEKILALKTLKLHSILHF